MLEVKKKYWIKTDTISISEKLSNALPKYNIKLVSDGNIPNVI